MKAINSVLVDLLLTILIVCVCMLMIAVSVMNPPAKDEEPERKAEFLIEMTWPDMSLDDIDIHVLLPDLQIVSYRNTDRNGGVSLDRDDTNGPVSGDWYVVDGERRFLRVNHETVAIRAIVPGRYVVNSQVYFLRDSVGDMTGVPLPYPAKLTLVQLNPKVRTVVSNEVILTKLAEQKTAFSFTLTPKGEVVEIDTESQIPFIAIGGIR